MYPFLAELAQKSSTAISAYPNAGLPNPLSPTGFDLEPADMARYLGEFAQAGLINIAGGCCGNTPEHIAAISKALEHAPPRHYLKGDQTKKGGSADAKRTSVAVGAAIGAAAGRWSRRDRFASRAHSRSRNSSACT
jgi:hypothetical protein